MANETRSALGRRLEWMLAVGGRSLGWGGTWDEVVVAVDLKPYPTPGNSLLKIIP
ncbi:MAG: hypothetical protein MH252_21335 [Thermosynechococcaceae cyanobacterium MS004]|nr:hypothetical protein [Thermosynechococcaceae cyanobacterium MS004]